MDKLENIPKVVEVKRGDGRYLFKLGGLLHERNISLNKLIEGINSEHKVVAKYVYGTVTVKLDMNIIAKICDYFKCDMSDIIEYISKK